MKEMIKKVYQAFKLSMCLATIIFACFNPVFTWILNAIVMTILTLPLIIKIIKED